jgi:O-antigen biosynthesis protein
LATPDWLRTHPVALALSLKDTLIQGSAGRPPSLLVIGEAARPEIKRFVEALGESAAVTVHPPAAPVEATPWDLILCLDLPATADGVLMDSMAQQWSAHTEQLLFAPLAWLADPLRYGDRLRRWIGACASAGLLYDNDTLPGEWQQAGALLLRRTHLSAEDAPGYLTLALRARDQQIARYQMLAAEADHQLASTTHLAMDLHRQLGEAQRQRQRLDQALGDVSGDWSRLRHSPGFLLLQKLQQMRARIAPPRTRRERLLEMALGWLRILERRGAVGLARHFRGEVAWRANALTARFDRRRHFRIEQIEIAPHRPRPSVRVHQASVDIVICVHNALPDLERCLDALQRHTQPPYQLILVDDGSDAPTRDFLAAFARTHPRAVLLRNEDAHGYTRAANQGLRQSSGEYAALLNSDTLVTRGWLDRLVACAESDTRIGLVGPLSNTASWQSIPAIAQGSDWAENPLPPGVDLDQWAAAIAQDSARLYPPMPLLNGFCLLIRRPVIDEIGLFDEENFGAGYGEENDYCLRTRAAGWRLALADDTFIYHAQSRSYSHERRKALSERSAESLTAKHGQAIIDQSVDYCRHAPVLEGIRARAAVLAERMALRERGRREFNGRRILFLLPADGPGGGANVVIAEARAMLMMGVEVAFFNLAEKRTAFEASYPGLDIPVRYGAPADVVGLAQDYDAVVATWYTSVFWLKDLAGPVLGYYVQDFEPYFFEPAGQEYADAVASYSAIPGLRCFTKTEWNRQEVQAQVGIPCQVVGPSVEIDRCRPQPGKTLEQGEHPVRVVAMVRPNSPRRSPLLTMQLLRRLSHRCGNRVEITVFGVQPNDPGLAGLPQDFHWRLAGVLDPGRVAALLAQADLFADFSTYQAMGLTALEAMASGAAVIVPQEGGASSFARHSENALIVDSSSEEACWEALVRLVDDDGLRGQLRRQAIYDACRFHPEAAAHRILTFLLGEGGKRP